MNITKSENRITTTKLINGETVNFTFCYAAICFLFIVLKQLGKIAIGLSAAVAVPVSFAISAAVFYLLEKKFVFTKKVRTTTATQILFTVLRCVVDLGFFKLCDFVFSKTLGKGSALVFLLTGILLLFFNYYFDRLITFDCRSNPMNNYNGRAYRLFFNNRFVILSSLIAMTGLGFAYIVFSVFPFGDTTVLRMDLYHQYGPLYCELFDRVTNHESFIYSWVSGGGTSFLGNYFNYLSSPISFVILLFDRKDMPFAITTMVMIKCMLSAATFTYYLKASQKSHTYASAAFGVFYAFCAYFLAYYWNIMWLDGMVLFPLVILGIEKIVDERKPLLYIASLTVLLYSTYYIGFMTCIFAVVYFFAYLAMSPSKAKPKPLKAVKKVNENGKKKKVTFSLEPLRQNRLISSGVTFGFSSLLAGMLCAVTLIPVYFILQSSSATSDAMPASGEVYFDIINIITSHLAGLTTTIRSSGEDVLPNIYCGILPVLLLPMFIMNKKIAIREKIVYVLLIIFFVFSFSNNFANFFWHAKHFPNDLPYRFSFMYSFLIIVVAYKALKHIKALEYKDIALVGMFWVMLVLFFQKFPTEKFNEATIYISLGLIMAWTAVLLVIRKGNISKLIAGITVVAIAFCEVIIADTSSYIFMRNEGEYVANYDKYQDTIKYVEGKDDGFYRQELCYLDTRMDPCLYGYNGISVFSSMAYEDYSGLQYSLGMFGNRINSYTYNTQTPVYNMMYNIKYLTQTETRMPPSDDFYSKFYSSDEGRADVYKNDYYLPISYVVSKDVDNWEFYEGNPFDVQESFIDNAAGVSDVFVPVKYVSTESFGCECEDVTENGVYSFTKDADMDGGTIDVTIETVNDSNLYIYISSYAIDNVNYFWDNEEQTEDQYIDEPYIMDLGKHEKGDKVRIELSLAGMDTDSSVVDIYAYNIDKDVFKSAYELLNTGAMDVTSHSDTEICGTVNAGFDGYLYSSIPYDEGWSVYVDGEKAEIFDLGNCQIAVPVKEGKHEVRYKFTPKGLKYGVVISGAAWLCVIVYGIYCTVVKKSKKRKTKENINSNI
ncbi:MAG: hypothetical protein E7571_04415 [Ruminococcaceae bacterium]|nr:hypothetical protein [Oscillospiraceae bacterium]